MRRLAQIRSQGQASEYFRCWLASGRPGLEARPPVTVDDVVGSVRNAVNEVGFSSDPDGQSQLTVFESVDPIQCAQRCMHLSLEET